MVNFPGQRRTQQKASGGQQVIQVARDYIAANSPASTLEHAATEVVWPVWVGSVPERATAFQHRNIEDQLRPGDETAALSQVLIGDGGVGKSQLAAHLTREMRDANDGLEVLVWVKASSPDQIITAYAETAERLHLPGTRLGGHRSGREGVPLLAGIHQTPVAGRPRRHHRPSRCRPVVARQRPGPRPGPGH